MLLKSNSSRECLSRFVQGTLCSFFLFCGWDRLISEIYFDTQFLWYAIFAFSLSSRHWHSRSLHNPYSYILLTLIIRHIVSGPQLWDKLARCDSHTPSHLGLKKHVLLNDWSGIAKINNILIDIAHVFVLICEYQYLTFRLYLI